MLTREAEIIVSSNALGASKVETHQGPSLRRKLSPGPGRAAREVAAHQLARIHDAIIQLVAEHGYKDLKVRDLVRRAEVSTRAFYEHFGSKEGCFLRTYDLISRRGARRIIAAQVGEGDWRKRSQLVLEEFVRGLERKPDEARLVLVESYVAGEASLLQARQAERTFEGVLAECFSRAPGGIKVPPLVVHGMIAGIISVARRQLLEGTVADLWASREVLLGWALSYPAKVAVELVDLDRQSVWRDTSLEPLPARSVSDGRGSWPVAGDRALILDAVAKLAAESGYSSLTVGRVRASASVSPRKFDGCFDHLEDCYLTAIDQRAGEAMAQAARAQAAAGNWLGGLYRAVAALCDYVIRDPFLFRVCLTDDFPPSQHGARSRQRLTRAVIELLSDAVPSIYSTDPLFTEASTAAIWSLFKDYTISNHRPHSPISATLSYLALTPLVGASAAITAIRTEQTPSRNHLRKDQMPHDQRVASS